MKQNCRSSQHKITSIFWTNVHMDRQADLSFAVAVINRRDAAQHNTNDPWDCEANAKFTGLALKNSKPVFI